MSSAVDVPVALLGYGTVGSAVDRLLQENAEDIERATGHRLRVVRALVRDAAKERSQAPADGVLTTDFAEIRDDPSIALVAEVMGGLEPTGEHVLDLLRAGKPVVSANKQLIARRGAELFSTASEAGVQLRFEASVCAAIPVIKILREALVVSNVHRVLGIVNGTTNFILTKMEEGAEYDEALAEAQKLGYAEADPTEDVNGADAAAKMAILATIAFGSRVTLDDVSFDGIERVDERARAGRAGDGDGRPPDRHGHASRRQARRPRRPGARRPPSPAGGGRGRLQRGHAPGGRHPRDHPRGPGRRGHGDGVGGRRRHGQRDRHDRHGLPPERRLLAGARTAAERRDALALLPPHRRGRRGRSAGAGSPTARRPPRVGRQARAAPGKRLGATLHVVTHEGAEGDLQSALQEIESLPETKGPPSALPVISDRGVPGLGWA